MDGIHAAGSYQSVAVLARCDTPELAAMPGWPPVFAQRVRGPIPLCRCCISNVRGRHGGEAMSCCGVRWTIMYMHRMSWYVAVTSGRLVYKYIHVYIYIQYMYIHTYPIYNYTPCTRLTIRPTRPTDTLPSICVCTIVHIS